MEKTRILLVDDEPNIRVILGAILESKGYMVDTAEDGFVALRKMQAAIPDLIISDLRMPNMNGFELLAYVRKNFPDMPIIAISGEFVGEQVEGVLADAFFQKAHYSPPDLLEKIEMLLTRPKVHAVKSTRSPIWAALGNDTIMITCCECLKSFPLDPCDEEATPTNEIRCIFCSAQLHYQLIAITTSASP